MSKRAEEAACKYAGLQHPPTDDCGVLTATDYYSFLDGYEQAEEDTIERVAHWLLRQKGIGKAAIADFRKAMEEK